MKLTDDGDVRISNFSRACETDKGSTREPSPSEDDEPDNYRAPEKDAFTLASDIFSVGMLLLEMAAGRLPGLDRDELLASIEDPTKRELVVFALHVEPSDRPTAAELLRKVTALAPTEASQQERTFRESIGDTAPWALDAVSLAAWLEGNWVGVEHEREQRRALVMQLSHTDGVQLLTTCMTEDGEAPPWVQLSQTKTGEGFEDSVSARHLTMYLHAHAGLCFHRQVWLASADPLSPLLKYEHVQISTQTHRTSTSVVRHQTGVLRCIKFARDSNEASGIREIEIHARASAATELVVRAYESGTPSPGIYFGIGELCSMFLHDRMKSQGLDDADFWRWSSQLARGTTELHRAGIVHGALLVCLPRSWRQHAQSLLSVCVHRAVTQHSSQRELRPADQQLLPRAQRN